MLILLYLIGCLKILWQPTPVFLPGESHGWRSLVGYSPRGCKESDTTEQLHFHFTFKDFMSLQSHHPGFPGDSACNAGDLGSIPGSESERVTGRKARGLKMEEIACKCQTFLSLLSGRRKQTNNIFFLLYTNLKRGFS